MNASKHQLKLLAAQAAVEYILPKLNPQRLVGVGTGSTADLFIDELSKYQDRFKAAVSSSKRSAERLESHGIRVLPLEEVSDVLPVYVDGADEINPLLQMVKGGGGALTQEKIVASAAQEFVCIADESKWVEELGEFNIPIEVISSARSVVSAKLMQLGAKAVHERTGFVTDNGHPILDVEGLRLADARACEQAINQIPGVVTCGLFALKPAAVLLMATPSGIKRLTARKAL